MVQFIVTVDTPSNFTKIMKFFGNTGIQFKIAESNTHLFAKMLKAVKEEREKEQLETSPIEEKSESIESVYMQPTDHFKIFCGSAWLTPKGLITKKLALYFLEQQIRMRKIKKDGDIIYTNDYLRDLLQVNLPIIYEKDIPSYINTLFVAHSKDS